MSLGRWAGPSDSRSEQRTGVKIGRIEGTIARVFRHGRDENGVGWSDIDYCTDFGSRLCADNKIVREESRNDLSRELPTSRTFECALGDQMAADAVFPTFEGALSVAYSTRFLLICDV